MVLNTMAYYQTHSSEVILFNLSQYRHQYGKFPSTMPDAHPRWWAKLCALLCRVRAALHRTCHTRNYTYCLVSALGNILLTFKLIQKIWLTFFSSFPDFNDFFPFIGHFVNLLGLSPAMSHKIPLCTKNFTTLMCWVWCKPYYARLPQNSTHNHATIPDIFGIACIFSSLV